MQLKEDHSLRIVVPNYLLDTSAVSRLLNEKADKGLTEKIKYTIATGKEIFISGVTYFEIKRGLISINSFKKLEKFNDFCNMLTLLLLDNKFIFDEAALIYKSLRLSGKLINDADILIAATAKYYELTLISDDKDFERIENIKVIKTKDWLNH